MHDIEVQRNVSVGGEDYVLVARSSHAGGIEATTVVHRQDFAHRVGGVRVVPRGTLLEAAHLAAGMTWKSAAAGVAVDGMKCLLSTRAKAPVLEVRDGPASEEGDEAAADLRVSALRAHVDSVRRLDPGVIFGPDMGSPPAFLARVARDQALLRHLTGLPPAMGGLDINGLGLTAHGVHEAVRTAWSGAPRRVLIQGFGAVGAYLADLLHRDGWRIVGISNRLGTLEARDGLDVPWLVNVREQGGDEAVAEAGRHNRTTGYWTASPDQLLTLTAELLVPAARTAAFALPGELSLVRREENIDAADVLRFCRNAGIRLVAEAANHPLTAGAEAALHSEGVTILPDVLVNCGGFIGCWVEWKLRNEASGANAREDGASCVARTRRTVRRNVQAFLAVDGSPRSTAKALARQARERLQASAREGSAPQSG